MKSEAKFLVHTRKWLVEIMVPHTIMAASLRKVVVEKKNSLLEWIFSSLLCVLDAKNQLAAHASLLCWALSNQTPGLHACRACSG